MKPFLIAAAVGALFLVPASAQAQIAAATVPNTFDRPADQAQAPAPVPQTPRATAPANAGAEEALRAFIAGAQAGTINYSVMTDDLAAKVREQEATIQPLIDGFGALLALDFVGARDGADLFAATFANAETQWLIGFDDEDEDRIAALLFRPAPAPGSE